MSEDQNQTLEQKVIAAINDIRPSLQNDGGDVEFVKMEGKIVTVKLLGHCAGCPMSQMTLKNGVQKYLQHVLQDQSIEVENNIDDIQ